MRLATLAAALCLAAAPVAAMDWLPTGLTANKHGHGWMFADAKGMTLYTFDKDEEKPGTSTCNGPCAQAWPPVVAAADAQGQGPWSLITRQDGAKQWAYKGKPLYTYAADAFPGALFGDGVGSVWRVALQPIPTPAEVAIGSTVLGEVLRDGKGLTLYTFDKDKPNAISCTKECLKTWKPVMAPWLANADEDFSVVTRDDGAHQWAFKGKPLYRYVGDINPGEASGATAAKGWHVALLEPAPPVPSFITIQASDAGELLATEKGLTIYAHGADNRARRVVIPGCPEGKECIDAQWVPLLAAADAKPLGSWALVDTADGKKQWTYKGQKLYTNVADTQPGDFKGIRFGGDRTFGAIMRNGQPMQGVTVGG